MKKTIRIHYNPNSNFPSVEDKNKYCEYCEKIIKDTIKDNTKSEYVIDVPDPLAAEYVELYGTCMNYNVIFSKENGDVISSKDFYKPFAFLYRESELLRTEVKDWLDGKESNPLYDDTEVGDWVPMEKQNDNS